MNRSFTPVMPAAFIGHGSPMNALTVNKYSAAWRQFGGSIPKPNAILSISAHWYTQGLGVTAMDTPRTIHDFGGFPQALFDMQYPAAGAPDLARRVRDLLRPLDVQWNLSWGLDHGTWSILVHMFPQADIPVVQLSIDATQPNRFHYELGRTLAPLRDEGVLLLGSGNVVHNLRAAQFRDQAPAYDWAVRFNDQVREHLQARNHTPLVQYDSFGDPARLSIPTPEHYLPMLYILGAQRDDDMLSILIDGIDLGSIGMLSFAIGPVTSAT